MSPPLQILALAVVVVLVVVSIDAKRKRRARPRPIVSAQVDTLHVGSPADGIVSIAFALERQANVELVVSDVAGRTVRSLISDTRPRGNHVVTWDGRDDRGHPQDPGFHFAQLRLDGRHVSTWRIVVAP